MFGSYEEGGAELRATLAESVSSPFWHATLGRAVSKVGQPRNFRHQWLWIFNSATHQPTLPRRRRRRKFQPGWQRKAPCWGTPQPSRDKTSEGETMAKYTFVVLTNAVDGKDDTFNEWYTNTHLGDVLAVPGFVSAQRFKLADAQRAKPPHPFRYLALYEIETNDLQKTLDELGKRSGTQAMVLTDTMAPGTQAHIYEAITSVVTPKH
jgi:hypothetical protein